MNRLRLALMLTALLAVTTQARNESVITISWPQEKPALKLSFEKFRETGSYNGQRVFISDVTVQNLTDKQIPRASFNVYFMDKNKVRIGEGLLQVADLSGG